MDQVLSQLFQGVRLKNSLAEFAPFDTIPWGQVEVDAFLDQGYQRTRADINAGGTIDKIEKAVNWVREQLELPSGADVLDVGCGVGLYSHRLAESGYRVIGTDINDGFLAFARARAISSAVRCRYHNLSMFAMNFSAEFDLVLVTQGPSLQLTPSDLMTLMARVRGALRPGGHVVCEFSVAPADLQARAPEVAVSASRPGRMLMGKPLRARMVRKLTFAEARQRVNHRIFLYQDGKFAEFWSRFILHTPSDLVAMLECIGFEIRGFFGPMVGQPCVDGQQTCHIWATLRRFTGGSG
jgi:SAM-dependent methyltransferase